jgi:upstream activation factor subunit UAF30
VLPGRLIHPPIGLGSCAVCLYFATHSRLLPIEVMPNVSDDDLRAHLRETLKMTDLATTTERNLRAKLEEHFGCDLKPRKPLFKEEIENFLAQCEDLEEEEPEDAEEEASQSRSGKKRGFHTHQSLSAELRVFLGVEESEDISRGEVMKRIWAYIKEHDLQDPKNKRKILADDKLATLFTFPLNMFSINKQLSKHCKSSSDVVGKAKPSKKAKPGTAKAGTGAVGEKKPCSGFTLPQKLSPQLAALLGVETASRGDCMKRLWAYIKEQGLQVCTRHCFLALSTLDMVPFSVPIPIQWSPKREIRTWKGRTPVTPPLSHTSTFCSSCQLFADACTVGAGLSEACRTNFAMEINVEL